MVSGRCPEGAGAPAFPTKTIRHTDTPQVAGGLQPLPAFEHQGLFWWSAHMLGWVSEPGSDLAGKLRRAESLAQMRKPAIGVHIRRGDACVHAAQSNTRPLCRGVPEYMAGVFRMASRYGAQHVALSTDDASVVEEVEAALQEEARRGGAELSLSAMRFGRGVFDSAWFIEHRVEAAAADASVIAESMLLDLLLLAECDMLVGTLSSQMSRLALSLMAIRRGSMPPFDSVDGLPWGCCTWAGESLNTSDPAAFNRISLA
ncbi:hypothetical protein T484DRAFT_1915304 [Baffinella frigidus]|nr:hypothetical protein T484DRAFT_1915304 [Cryptophyta sp. CCMP2293]